ncbi:fused MFS/spermidine synthase [Virgisporangium ochraceum]
MGRRTRNSPGVTERVDSGDATLAPDPDHPVCWTLAVDGLPQSYVDTANPRNLRYRYMRHLADVVDATAPADLLHLGGGALTLPRYVAATRPSARQRVVEKDAALTDLVRRVLPLPRGAHVRVRAADARAAVEATGDARFDLVVADVYSAARVPASLGTVEAAAHIARVLRPHGWYATNLADGRDLAYTRGQVATLKRVFADLCLIAEPGVLKGRYFGNLVAVAGPELPVADLATNAAADQFPCRLLHGADLDNFVAGARPVTDADARESPAPPASLFR